MIEDLAVKDSPSNPTYQYVVSQKGEHEVLKRREFLEVRK